MKENEILWVKILKLRNDLQQKCFKNKHSYVEEIKISVPDGVTIETVIGGRDNGNVVWSLISPADDLFLRMSSHIDEVKKSYERSWSHIIKDLNYA